MSVMRPAAPDTARISRVGSSRTRMSAGSRQLNNWHEDTSTMTDVLDNTDLSRTARFAKFLREAVAVKTKRVLEVQKYPHVVWFGDFPADLQEIRSPLLQEKWPATDSAWLKVAKVQEPARPAAPKACAPWLVGLDPMPFGNSEPTVRPR